MKDFLGFMQTNTSKCFWGELTAWEIVTDMLQCTLGFLYILDPCLIWRYLYRVKRWHWIIHSLSLHQVLHSMCDFTQTFNNNMNNNNNILQSAVVRFHWWNEWCVFWDTLPAAGVFCCFHFTHFCVSFLSSSFFSFFLVSFFLSNSLISKQPGKEIMLDTSKVNDVEVWSSNNLKSKRK